ncbi:Uncharacterised protein [Burkholderia pseudomallei]|nr:Uncharacterised protein [Burkholderia pseudomallei]
MIPLCGQTQSVWPAFACQPLINHAFVEHDFAIAPPLVFRKFSTLYSLAHIRCERHFQRVLGNVIVMVEPFSNKFGGFGQCVTPYCRT